MQPTIEITTLLSITLYLLIAIGLIVLYRAFRYPLNEIFRKLNPFRLNRRLNNQQDSFEQLEASIYEDRSKYNRRLKKIGKRLKKYKAGLDPKTKSSGKKKKKK